MTRFWYAVIYLLVIFAVQPSNAIKVTDYNLYDLTAPSDWLPIRWLAPETLKYRKHNEKSDMWSYGKCGALNTYKVIVCLSGEKFDYRPYNKVVVTWFKSSQVKFWCFIYAPVHMY